MMRDIEKFAGVSLGPGTLYTAITRLVVKKLIVSQAPAGRQRPYKLTASGAESLEAQLREMRRIALAGLRRLQPV